MEEQGLRPSSLLSETPLLQTRLCMYVITITSVLESNDWNSSVERTPYDAYSRVQTSLERPLSKVIATLKMQVVLQT